MKKQLPSIFVIGGALLTALIIFLWPYINPPVDKSDKDGDGFDDKIDQCVDVASNTNMGCPEKPYLGIDKDRDGLFAGFQKDANLSDPNDNNSCDPKDTCAYCDSDGDGLYYPQELTKGSNPRKDDSDGDGIKDGQDHCIMEYGIEEMEGCPINININLSRKGLILSWNSELNKQESYTQLIITCTDDNNNIPEYLIVTNLSSYDISKIVKKSNDYTVELKTTLKNPKAVKLINPVIRW